MADYEKSQSPAPGDLIQLVGLSHKSFIFTLTPGQQLHTHRGVVQHDDLIGKDWGSQIFSHNGSPFFLLQPSLPDLLKHTKRATQIMYPKEIGYILLHMGIVPGTKVIEAGTGSGSFTSALASFIGEKGKVYTYEVNEKTQSIARKSLEKLHLSERVEFKVRDISEGFDEIGVDVIHSIDEAIQENDVLNVLRIQLERKAREYFPSIREYSQYFGIDRERLEKNGKDILILHPGPINRGVEISSEVADGSSQIILQQVTNGVAVRMAVLYLLGTLN